MGSDWRKVNLAQLLEVKGGKRLPAGVNLIETPNDHPYIRVRDLSGVRTLELNSQYLFVDNDTQKLIKNYIVAIGDIVISIVGTIGLVAIVGKSLKKANLTENCVKLTNLQGVESLYLYYFLKSPLGQNEIARGTVGAVQAKLPIKSILNIELELPPLSEQRFIAATLSCLDDKIELNNRIIANLEAQAQAIFKSWFVDFEPFQDGEFEESELGLIPKGWRCGTFSDLGNIEGGSTPSKSEPSYYCENGIPWITPRDLSSDKRKFIDRGANDITESGLKNSSAKILPAETVLFSSRAPIGYITIAKNGVSTNQGFKSIIPFKMIGTAYVYYYLKQNTDRIIAAANGSTFKEISGTVLKNLTALIPEAQILKDFSALCETLFKQQAVLEEQNGILTITRDTLLPKLMSGEIEVPVEG